MNNQLYNTLSIKLNKPNYLSFSPLLQQGFLVQAEVGRSIKNVLCEQFKVGADYLAEHIKTIFLDGKPVDDPETAIVKDDSTLALAAAMPGLVGATFRRGGVLASFRNTISHQEEGETEETNKKGMVKIKLFNMVIRDLGPVFLENGIWLEEEDIEDLFKNEFQSLKSFIDFAEKDGEVFSPEQLTTLNWSEKQENIFLRVFV